MNGLGRLVKSSVGAKAIMAVTGAGLIVFVIVHLLGNLQIFLGQDAYNSYAQKLQDMGALLWVARAGLLLLFVTHISLAFRLWRANTAARPVPYQFPQQTLASNPAAKTMWLTGAVIFWFVIYHLVHFTFGGIQHDSYALVDSQGRHDVYNMVVRGFRNPAVAITYVVAQAFLGMHLFHGGSSFFQSLGLNHPKYNAIIRKTGLVVAVFVVAGNVLIPLTILFGIVRPV